MLSYCFRTCTILHITALPYSGHVANARKVMCWIHTQRSALNQLIALATTVGRVTERVRPCKRIATRGMLTLLNNI
jgi:hypothetical protein